MSRFEEGGMSLNQLKDYFGADNIDDNGSFSKAGGGADAFKDDAKIRKFFVNELGRSPDDWDDDVTFENDLNTAVRAMYDGEGGEDEGSPEPGKTFNDYEFSPQVQEAMDRVESYRERALSGQTANEIYGKSNSLAEGNSLGIDRGSPYAGVSDQNGAAAASDQQTNRYFNSDKYKINLREDIQKRVGNKLQEKDNQNA